jgi:hypothetical protein
VVVSIIVVLQIQKTTRSTMISFFRPTSTSRMPDSSSSSKRRARASRSSRRRTTGYAPRPTRSGGCRRRSSKTRRARRPSSTRTMMYECRRRGGQGFSTWCGVRSAEWGTVHGARVRSRHAIRAPCVCVAPLCF